MAIKVHSHNIVNRITTLIKAFVPQRDEFIHTTVVCLGTTLIANIVLHAEYSHLWQNAFQKGATSKVSTVQNKTDVKLVMISYSGVELNTQCETLMLLYILDPCLLISYFVQMHKTLCCLSQDITAVARIKGSVCWWSYSSHLL